MKSGRLILLLFLAIVGIVVAVAASGPMQPLYVDDVYYWPDDDPLPAVTEQTSETETLEPAPKPQVIFLDDSITRQNPDTVVRVRIKR